MLDTIALTLDFTQFRIERHDMFTPNTAAVFVNPTSIRFGKEKVIKYRNNATPAERKQGYWPRLTLSVSPARVGGGLAYTLRVEFSAPKVLFGNNFEEMTDADFKELLGTLVLSLRSMGVATDVFQLGKAQVSAIHFSKNIILGDYTRCSMVLGELAKLNLWQRLDVNTRDYRNHGHVLKWHANSYEICVYDKVKDLEQAGISPKRAEEADPLQQPGLLDMLQRQQRQVLRLEVRLNTRTKLRAVLKAIKMPDDISLVALFQQDLAKVILAHFWQAIMAAHPTASILEADLRQPDKYVEALLAQYPTLSPNKALSLYGTACLIQKVGEKAAAVILASRNPRTAKRLFSECKAHQPKGAPRWVAAQQVRVQLEKFQPLKLEDVWYMNDLELIFTMLGEASTTAISRSKDAKGFTANRDAAREGGKVAGDARKKLELQTGKPVVCTQNYLPQPAKKKANKKAVSHAKKK